MDGGIDDQTDGHLSKMQEASDAQCKNWREKRHEMISQVFCSATVTGSDRQECGLG